MKFAAPQWARAIVLIGSLGCCTSVVAAEKEQSRELIVLPRQTAAAYGQPYTAEGIVDAVRSDRTDEVSAGIWARLQNPRAARFVVSERLPQTARARLAEEDPEERLQRYVVVEYNTSSEAAVANAFLQKDGAFLSVGENFKLQFSAVPNDTYWTLQFSELEFQWGPRAMNLEAAWDKVKGNAYIALLDNGIQLQQPNIPGRPQNGPHPELHNPALPNAAQPWLTPFRPQFAFNAVNSALTVDEAPVAAYQVAGHGSHTAGIIAAATDNGTGTAGVCWGCSLVVVKVSRYDPAFSPPLFPDVAATVDGINYAVRGGVQAINMSFGTSTFPDPNFDCYAVLPQQWASFKSYCDAIDFARVRNIQVVAAAGNERRTQLDFPAANPYVIGVGGVQYAGGFVPPQPWSQTAPWDAGTNGGPNLAVVAPARHILSTVYTGYNWNEVSECGDSTSFLNDTIPGSSAAERYGSCTGTSMAAPHVTGLVGLLRTINPLLTNDQTRQLIVNNSSRSLASQGWDPVLGYGLPDANAAVNAALSQTNRLTPLFSLNSVTASNYFYTVVPQMAATATRGFTLPRPTSWALTMYTGVGSTINEFPAFAAYNQLEAPRAQVWVFTTPLNPMSSTPLAPLYRLSWKCGDGGAQPYACSTNPDHVDHTYTTDFAGLDYFRGLGYRLDGIEGYIYPSSEPQPTGTVKLYRRYNWARDDHAIFPESELNNMVSQGYIQSVGNDWIGYVYPNSGPRPTY